MPHLSPTRLRLLTPLAESNNGVSASLLTAHGFKASAVAALFTEGLVTTKARPIRAGGTDIQVTMVAISEAGKVLLG
jgi:hypothetical protein